MIYFIGQNIHLTSLALHEKWWNSAMTGYLAWLAAGGFNAPIPPQQTATPAPKEKTVTPPPAKVRVSKTKAKVKAKVAKESPLKLLETSDHS